MTITAERFEAVLSSVITEVGYGYLAVKDRLDVGACARGLLACQEILVRESGFPAVLAPKRSGIGRDSLLSTLVSILTTVEAMLGQLTDILADPDTIATADEWANGRGKEMLGSLAVMLTHLLEEGNIYEHLARSNAASN